jgi:hypothetical protein
MRQEADDEQREPKGDYGKADCHPPLACIFVRVGAV